MRILLTLLLPVLFSLALLLGIFGALVFIQDRKYEREAEQIFQALREGRE